MYSSTHSLTSALDGGEWSALRPGRFTPRERAPGTHWIGGWVDPRAILDPVVKRKIPSRRRESNLRTLIVQPVTQRYTDCALPNDMFFWWDNFHNDLECDCNKLGPMSSVLSLLWFCFRLHTQPVSPNFRIKQWTVVFVRHFLIWKRFLAQYKRIANKIMLSIEWFCLIKTPQVDTRTEHKDGCPLALLSRLINSANIDVTCCWIPIRWPLPSHTCYVWELCEVRVAC
jgi:hypothetical protein